MLIAVQRNTNTVDFQLRWRKPFMILHLVCLACQWRDELELTQKLEQFCLRMKSATRKLMMYKTIGCPVRWEHPVS